MKRGNEVDVSVQSTWYEARIVLYFRQVNEWLHLRDVPYPSILSEQCFLCVHKKKEDVVWLCGCDDVIAASKGNNIPIANNTLKYYK